MRTSVTNLGDVLARSPAARTYDIKQITSALGMHPRVAARITGIVSLTTGVPDKPGMHLLGLVESTFVCPCMSGMCSLACLCCMYVCIYLCIDGKVFYVFICIIGVGLSFALRDDSHV